MPKIVATENGFTNWVENAEVEYVECDFAERTCIVHFYKHPPKKLFIECSSFNMQYGIPVSDDGTQLFFSDWDNGLWAYNLDTGNADWFVPLQHVTFLTVNANHLIAMQQNQALLCLDIRTGLTQHIIKSRNIKSAFSIAPNYLLIDSIAGRICAIKIPELSTFKRYSVKLTNPHKCLSFLIQQIELRDNALVIKGVEEYPNGVMIRGHAEAFSRTIDSCFHEK